MEKSTKPLPLSSVLSDNTSSRQLLSTDLFRGNTVVEIEHAGQRYLLRRTRENKLILTK